MANELHIRRLEKSDNRTDFSCGNSALDRFFRDYAGQNQFRFHLAVTYVAVLEEKIVGFATVSFATLERESLPGAKLKKRLPAYPLPVLRLARLGVHERGQGKGIGKALLRYVLLLALQMKTEVGCVGVLTDAKPEAVGFYRRYGFVELNQIVEGTLHGDPTPMFLPLRQIESALK
jgi:GNAT superfamily N-acetyltransferase